MVEVAVVVELAVVVASSSGSNCSSSFGRGFCRCDCVFIICVSVHHSNWSSSKNKCPLANALRTTGKRCVLVGNSKNDAKRKRLLSLLLLLSLSEGTSPSAKSFHLNGGLAQLNLE